MARICEHCGRRPLKAVSRSHSNIATKRRQMLNLQWKRLDGERVRICANCIKTMNRVRI
ncbi:50S ribosomal protein L28 [Candidatus Uhrbacteria bacterium]|nr:50S ribosomal protein L28 [Candidatus Uhrbacteria bacterium]